MLAALKTIGEAIADAEFRDPWEQYWTPGKMADAQTVVVIRLVEREGEGGLDRVPDGDEDDQEQELVLDYTGTRLRSAGDPVDMARAYGYVYNHIRDQSLTQRVAGSPAKNLGYLMEWPDQEAIGDVRDAPLMRALREVFEREGDVIREGDESRGGVLDYFDTGDEDDGDEEDGDRSDERETLTPSSSEPVFLTIEVVDQSGASRWPGEIDAFREAARNYRRDKLATRSAGSGNTGEAVCSVCNERGPVYGAGAPLDRIYTLKRQGPFAGYNASEAWRNRPLCIECITAIETAWERFVGPQQYGLPGIRCKVIPYALPVSDGDEQLRTLIRHSRDDIIGTERYDGDEAKRPLARAWSGYRDEIDRGRVEDALRLSIIHYRKDQSRSHTMSLIDGVSQPGVERVEATAAAVTERPAYIAALRPGGPPEETGIRIAPSEREIWTGMWAYNLLAREASRSGDDPEPGDAQIWIEVTAALLTGGSLPFESVISAVADELRARIRSDRDQGIDRESDLNDPYYAPPFDGIHVAEIYVLLETLAACGVLDVEAGRESDSIDAKPTLRVTSLTAMSNDRTDRDDDQEQNDQDQNQELGSDAEYPSLGAAVEAYIDAHEPIAASPGRTAAFAMGVMSASLSSWQQRRDLNSTHLQNVDINSLSVDSLPRMRSKIWDKARTYNAQKGNYGTPWSDLHAIVDKAILDGESGGWEATRDDVQTYFIMGSVAGPRLSSLVESKQGDKDEDETADELPTEPESATEAEPEQLTD